VFMNRFRKLLLVSLSIVMLFSMMAAGNATDKDCPKRVKVQVEDVKGSIFIEHRNYSTKLNPEVLPVVSKIAGKLTSLKVAEGDLVSENLLLAEINNLLKTELEKAEQEIKRWGKTLKRRKGWKVRSKRAEEQAERKLNEAKLKLDELKAKVPDCSITASLSGKVMALKVAENDEVTEKATILEIENVKKMIAELSIAEEDLHLFSEGQLISVEINDETIEVKVSRIEGNTVQLEYDNQEDKIGKGTSIKFSMVKKEHRDAVVLSEDIILKDETNEYVYKVGPKKKTANRANIKIGAKEDQNALVLEGVSIGDEVIKTELDCLKDGKKIKVMEMDSTTGKLKKKKYKKVKPVKAEAPVPVVATAQKEETPEKDPAVEKEAVEEQKKKEKEAAAALKAEKKAEESKKKEEARKQKEEAKKQKALEKQKQKEEKARLKALKCKSKVKVLTEKVRVEDFIQYKEFSATFVPEMAAVRSPIAGKVVQLNVTEGDFITEGWAIAVVDDNFKQKIKDAKAEIKKWERELKKRKNWKQRSQNSEAQAEQKIQENKARLQELGTLADGFSINSPIAGKVKSLQIKKGDDITAESLIVEIENIKELKSSITIVAEDNELFLPGSKIPVSIEGIDEKLEIEVLEVSEGVASLKLANQYKQIKDQCTVGFQLVKEQFDNAIVVPKSIVSSDETGTFVYIVNGNKAKKQGVTLGLSTDGKIMVTEGLAIEDEVIVKEVLVAKEGTLRDIFTCLKDNIRIIFMEKAPEANVFIVKGREYKGPKEPGELSSFGLFKKSIFVDTFHIGATVNAYSINDEAFSNFYNTQKRWMGFQAGIETLAHISIWGSIKYYKDDYQPETNPELNEFKITATSIGIKYSPLQLSVFKPYIGVGLDFYSFEENVGSELLEDVKDSASGFDINAGTFLRFKSVKFLEVQLGFKYTFIKKILERYETEYEFDLGGFEAILGLLLTF
jgi:membrane fusion protein (multidrug efflux system)